MSVSEREKREKETREYHDARRENGEVVHVPAEFEANVPTLDEKKKVEFYTVGGRVFVNSHGLAELDGDAMATFCQVADAARLRVA